MREIVFFRPIRPCPGISIEVFQGPREGQVLDETTGTLVQLLGEDRIGGGQSFRWWTAMPIYDGQIISQLSSAEKQSDANANATSWHSSNDHFQTKQRYFQLLQTIKLLEVQQERVRVSEEKPAPGRDIV